jgi:hypothetical protein
MIEQHPHHRPRAIYSPVFTLGSIVSIMAILGGTVTITLYASTIRADGEVTQSRVEALEHQSAERATTRVAERAEILHRLDRMEDTLNEIRSAQTGQININRPRDEAR